MVDCIVRSMDINPLMDTYDVIGAPPYSPKTVSYTHLSQLESDSRQYLLLHIHPQEVLWRHFRDRLVQALLRKLHLSALLAMYIRCV